MQTAAGIQNIVVTGASTGIGREIVLALSKLPEFRVFAIARREALLNSLVDECGQSQVIPIALDISRCNNKVLTEALDRIGVTQIRLVVGNAGTLLNKSFDLISSDEWIDTYRTNVIGPAVLIRDLLPYLGQQGVSHVLNISSMGGLSGTMKFPGLTAYSSSKGALTVLTEVLAEEYKDRSVIFNGLALGSVATDMLAKAFPGYQASVSAMDMAEFIIEFGLEGWRFFRGKVLPVSNSTP